MAGDSRRLASQSWALLLLLLCKGKNAGSSALFHYSWIPNTASPAWSAAPNSSRRTHVAASHFKASQANESANEATSHLSFHFCISTSILSECNISCSPCNGMELSSCDLLWKYTATELRQKHFQCAHIVPVPITFRGLLTRN